MCDDVTQAGRNRMEPVTARNFVREMPVIDVVRFQILAILHKDYFDVTVQFLVYYNRTGYDVKYLLPVGIDIF